MTTIGEVRAAVEHILAIEDEDQARKEARLLMDAYRLLTIHAASNVGYLAGYYDPATSARIYDLFECAHPIFGTRTDLEPDEVYTLGQRWAQEED